MLQSSLLFLTTLKLIACEQCAPGTRFDGKKLVPNSDIAMLKLPKMPNVKPFQSILDFEDFFQEPEPEDFSACRQKQIEIFKAVTGIDPEMQKIKAIVVLNSKDLIHVFRRIWQDFGPFPLIGCDSEGIAGYFDQKDLHVKKEDLNRSTCGLVILDDPANLVKCASIVLEANDDSQRKISDLKNEGFLPHKSWGIALSTCLRGYAGDDITPEIIEAKNDLHIHECELFHSIVGKNFVGAQVEDVFGTHHINNETFDKTEFDEKLCDSFGLFTPEIIADDSSAVFLVIGQQE